ncbi:copper resistance protein B [Acinetobacter sp. ANC 4178]|uniref:copper resistance protein B n=1 Tax=Acinetobacter sp. ANC 4178 TaxID=2529839 RepID=UPI00103A8722|nr:copper resistance protein B [Acinetobacter sp. ANC 4178]TCB67906.1 copper resistance protein B [Acinetobacter sp. ANC 4178]
MRSINVFPQTVLAGSLLLLSQLTLAQAQQDPTVHQQQTESQGQQAEMDHSQMQHNMPSMDHSSMQQTASSGMTSAPDSVKPVQASQSTDHSHHQQVQGKEEPSENKHSGHDHRAEHGAQIYAVTTVDNKWLLNEEGKGTLKSEFETRIGTDENKLFIKAHLDKHESHAAEYEVKTLYSRMISDFWDAQIGTRYRVEKVELDQHRKDTEEKLDAVIGLHGLAPYFFETDAYLYAGADQYSGFSLETERDLLLTQKLIFKPYLDVDLVFSDDSKYAQKTGLSNVTAGLETRYEISKKVMPYIDMAYEYSKGKDATPWQIESGSEKGWLYGAGIRFKF